MRRTILTFLGIVLLSTSAHAASVRLLDDGGGRWRLDAEAFSDVASIDITLSYDPTGMNFASATPGTLLQGLLFADNLSQPGLLRIGAVGMSPVSGNGTLALLSTGTSPATLQIRSFSVRLHNPKGESLAVSTILPAPKAKEPDIVTENPTTATDEPGATTDEAATVAEGRTLSGTVSFRNDSAPLVAPRSAEPTSPPDVGQNRGTATAPNPLTSSAPSLPEKRFHAQQEIVKAIEQLPRPWTVAAIRAIFLAPATSSPVRQYPPVVVADGVSKVSLFLPRALSQISPAIGVQGCALGAVHDAEKEGWEIELITRKGSWPAKALLLGDRDLIQFPVVVVPRLTIVPPATDNAFIPPTDYDADGSITALDAYLYVGNLLADEPSFSASY